MAAARTTPTLRWLAAALVVVVAFLVVGVIVSAISPSPSGPALSSYATTPRGVAAWAELLRRDGHSVSQIRKPFADTRLPANATVVVLAGAFDLLPGQSGATPADVRALQHFLDRGGRAVLGGQATAIAATLHGDVERLPDPTFVQNRSLAKRDNAFRALALAGPSSRPVYFYERLHGFGPATGLAALPERWWFAIAGLALSLGAWALSRAVRLGGSDPLPTPGPSPRAAYIEAMAQTLVRTADHDDLARAAKSAANRESALADSLRSPTL